MKNQPSTLYLLIGSGIIIATGIFFWQPDTAPPKSSTFPMPSLLVTQSNDNMPTPTQNNTDNEIQIKGKNYIYQKILESPSSSHRLIGNFNTKQNAEKLLKQYKCDAATSGSFYDTTGKPIGLFISDGEKVQDAQKNDLFIAYAWSVDGKKIQIETTPPTENVAWALQSGPLLVRNGTPTTLKLKIDEPARRIVLTVDENDKYVFFVIAQSDDFLRGPPLAELPQVIDKIQKKEQKIFFRAINLDGGNHSFFFDGTTKYEETAPIGSIICIFTGY